MKTDSDVKSLLQQQSVMVWCLKQGVDYIKYARQSLLNNDLEETQGLMFFHHILREYCVSLLYKLAEESENHSVTKMHSLLLLNDWIKEKDEAYLAELKMLRKLYGKMNITTIRNKYVGHLDPLRPAVSFDWDSLYEITEMIEKVHSAQHKFVEGIPAGFFEADTLKPVLDNERRLQNLNKFLIGSGLPENISHREILKIIRS